MNIEIIGRNSRKPAKTLWLSLGCSSWNSRFLDTVL